MHIFIDESGPFGGIGQFPSVSLIGALIVPDVRLEGLEKQYKGLRRNLPKDEKGEVKGRLLNEQQVDSTVSLLLADSALFEAAAIATAGLELVDIITNATRRALRGNLQQKGWGRIPQLMVHRGKREYISLFSLQPDPEPDRVYPYAEVLNAFRRDGRLLLPAHERKKLPKMGE